MTMVFVRLEVPPMILLEKLEMEPERPPYLAPRLMEARCTRPEKPAD